MCFECWRAVVGVAREAPAWHHGAPGSSSGSSTGCSLWTALTRLPAAYHLLCSGGLAAEFRKAAEDLSYTDAARAGVASVVGALAALEASAKKGALPAAKSDFVGAVTALQGWARDAGVAGSLKGL